MTPLSLNLSRNQDFEELTETLTSEKKSELINKLQRLDKIEETTQKILDICDRKQYIQNASLFHSPSFEYYALRAVQEKHLTAIQYASLMFVRSSLSQWINTLDFEIFPIFKGNEILEPAKTLIENTLKHDNKTLKEPFLEKEKLNLFFEILKTQPVSEHFFILIPDTQRIEKDNITLAINKEGLFNVFCKVSYEFKEKRMIPSFGMIKALIDACLDDSFRFKLVLGSSTSESLKNSILKNNAREMCIHSPQIAKAPLVADGYHAPPLDFMYHDFYHLWSARWVLKKDRKFYCELAEEINPAQYLEKTAQKIAEKFADYFIDLEMMAYRKDLGHQIEFASYISFKSIIGDFVPKEVELIIQKISLQNEKIFFKDFVRELQRKTSTLYCIWKLYKSDYQHFEEITHFANQLDPQVRSDLGLYFLEIEDFCFSLRQYPLICFDDLKKIDSQEIINLRNFLKNHRFPIQSALYKGMQLKEIFKFPEEKRVLMIKEREKILDLGKFGVSLEEIGSLDIKQLEYVLTDYDKIQKKIKTCLENKESIKFKHLIEEEFKPI